jgi:hypothetical protein
VLQLSAVVIQGLVLDLVLSAFPWLSIGSPAATDSQSPQSPQEKPYSGSEIPVNSYLLSEDTEGEL